MSDSIKVTFRDVLLDVEYEEDEAGIQIYGVMGYCGIPAVPPLDIFGIFDKSETDKAELVEVVQIAVDKENEKSFEDHQISIRENRERELEYA